MTVKCCCRGIVMKMSGNEHCVCEAHRVSNPHSSRATTELLCCWDVRRCRIQSHDLKGSINATARVFVARRHIRICMKNSQKALSEERRWRERGGRSVSHP